MSESSSIGSAVAHFEVLSTAPRAARTFVADTLESLGAPDEIRRDFALAVSELVTNFVEHSAGGDVTVIIDTANSAWWDVEVVGGPGAASKRMPEPHQWDLAAAEQISGRGLGIVRRLMEHVVVDIGPERVSVHCRVRRDTDPAQR